MVDIIPIDYGKSVLSESMIFENGAKNKFRPIIFRVYLIRTENRLILVDAGCETMPDFDMRDFIGPVKALCYIGISPEKITDLIITILNVRNILKTPPFISKRTNTRRVKAIWLRT
mgnify:CR=1 FL=1